MTELKGCRYRWGFISEAPSSKLPKELMLTSQVPEIFAICTSWGRKVTGASDSYLTQTNKGDQTNGGQVRARNQELQDARNNCSRIL